MEIKRSEKSVKRRSVRVYKVGSGLASFHGESSSVISQSSFMSSVKSAKPMSFFCCGVSNFSSISTPWTSSDPKEPPWFWLLPSASFLIRRRSVSLKKRQNHLGLVGFIPFEGWWWWRSHGLRMGWDKVGLFGREREREEMEYGEWREKYRRTEWELQKQGAVMSEEG